MPLKKSNNKQTPMRRRSLLANDPFFSDLMDSRRGMLNLNRLFDADDFDITPAVNIKDHEKKYEIEMAAPGLSKEDFHISMDNGVLTISAEKKEETSEEQEGFVKKEFSYNNFSRSMSLPKTIDEDKEVKAQYKDGVLRMTLQKKEDATKTRKPKTIKVY